MTAETVVLAVGATEIRGDLRVPANAAGIVVFAHGSGSSRFSTRNRAVAAALEARAFGTLLLRELPSSRATWNSVPYQVAYCEPSMAVRSEPLLTL